MATTTIDWDFVERFYPNYYSCSTITLIDILTRARDGEEVSLSDQTFIEGWDVERELHRLERKVFNEAYENMKNTFNN
ncbi:hypothetical protein [Flavobacterium stagni]|uniref:Uncharacterized protein n=1 Tax=Flavobacterium stagni TaxID=2506421 RepID=A0A4Q1KDY1_9FLAO|nr:hypothetical protein [Flavobacterium stagni]RXR24473.1 hypothetical protein EQG61_03225 [Flavobacterium stagni]